MLQTILVPLDGSPLAEQALGPACRLAAQTGASLVLLRAVPTAGRTGVPTSPSWREAERYLGALKGLLAGASYPVRIEIMRTSAARAIAFTARMQGADLIAMSTHGRTGLLKVLLGSVAQEVLEQTTLPVLLVPASHGAMTPPSGTSHTILVPLDGSPESEAALAFVSDAGLARADLVLLRTVPVVPLRLGAGLVGYDAQAQLELAQQKTERQTAAARQYLEDAASRFLQGASPRFLVVTGNAGDAIPVAAGAEGAELIVMATHGRSGLDRLVHGSVAAHVLHRAPTPVLLVHVEEAQPAAGTVTETEEVSASVAATSAGSVER